MSFGGIFELSIGPKFRNEGPYCRFTPNLGSRPISWAVVLVDTRKDKAAIPRVDKRRNDTANTQGGRCYGSMCGLVSFENFGPLPDKHGQQPAKFPFNRGVQDNRHLGGLQTFTAQNIIETQHARYLGASSFSAARISPAASASGASPAAVATACAASLCP
jgi:hypothetical protein